MMGLLGEKIGMTQIYDKERNLVPVTVVRVLSHVVTALRLVDKNGYSAVQLGSGEVKEKRLNSPQLGYFKKNGLKPLKWLKEFRVSQSGNLKIGSEIKLSVFKIGDGVDVQGVSKGKGFQGVMKRWHFAGGRDSHGCSLSHRVPGSIGQRAYPGRVMRGHKMAGHMGDDTVTVKNLKVVGIEEEQNLVLIKGAIPGANGSQVVVYDLEKDFLERVLSLGGSEEAVA